MEDIHRKHIENNVKKLIQLTNYEKLMNACLCNGLLTSVMKRNIENQIDQSEHTTEEELKKERHKRLFLKLTKRGPTAYQMLKNILMELGCDEAVLLLNQPGFINDNEFHSLHERPRRTPQVVQREVQILKYNFAHTNEQKQEEEGEGIGSSKMQRSVPKLEVYSDIIPIIDELVVKKAKAEGFHEILEVYPMRKEQRGVFFMVNIVDFIGKPQERRNGAEQDGKTMLYLFKELGFTLFAYNNITKDEFSSLLDELIDSKYTKEAECFVMALMTHGNMDRDGLDRVQFHDGAIKKVCEIQERFQNQKCPNLVYKPKILIFPFCRGDYPDLGQRIQTDGFVEARARREVQWNMPTTSDLLICHATPPGFQTHRDPGKGSWYIQNFCKAMAEHAHNTDFEDIIKKIQEDTSTWRTAKGALQMGSYLNIGFNKKLYLNPGLVKKTD